MIQKKKLSIAVILMSIVLISNNINIVGGSLLLQAQVMVSDIQNSFFGKEIIIQPETKAEAIYAMERSNALANLKNKIGKQHKNANSAQTSLEKESNRLSQESKQNKFCNENDVCRRAFTNSYFATKNWKLDTNSKNECIQKTVTAKNGQNEQAFDRQLVRCKIKEEKGVTNVFLESSTRYKEGKNLIYFAMTEENGKVKPKAFLMNKKESKEPKKTIKPKEAEKPMEKPQKQESKKEETFRDIPIEDGSSTTIPIIFTSGTPNGRMAPLTML